MLSDWELAEKKVKDLTGGRFTPASGAKKVKGDVRVEDYMLEVKQTSKETLAFQHLWLEKLERYRHKYELAIVIFFELRGYVYYYKGPKIGINWKTLSLKEDKLPTIINSQTGEWELAALNSLTQLKNNG
jgi:hypothetical protein